MLTEWKMGIEWWFTQTERVWWRKDQGHDFPALLNSKFYDVGVVHRIQFYVSRSNVTPQQDRQLETMMSHILKTKTKNDFKCFTLQT